MAKARKDARGRALRKGEVQRASDGRYMYTFTDPLGRRQYIYTLFLPGNPAAMRVSGVSHASEKCVACVSHGGI